MTTNTETIERALVVSGICWLALATLALVARLGGGASLAPVAWSYLTAALHFVAAVVVAHYADRWPFNRRYR